MKKHLAKITCILIAVVILWSFTGCNTIKNRISSSSETKEKVLTSSNGLTQITLPAGWSKATDLNDEADLQASRASKEMYFIVLSEDKQAFADDTSLEDYYNIVSNSMTESIKNPRVEGKTQTTVNGYSAIQCDIHGEVDRIKASYLFAVVETENNFHQLIGWSLQYLYDKNKDEIKKVRDSFKEISNNSIKTE